MQIEWSNYLQGVWKVSPPVFTNEKDFTLTAGFVVLDVGLEAGENIAMKSEINIENILFYFNDE